MMVVAATTWAEQPLVGSVSLDTSLISTPEVTVTEADYRQALLGLPSPQRAEIERDAATLRDFLLELYTERRLEQEAQRLGLSEQPEVRAEVEMARRKILVSAVIRKFRAGLPQPDFTELAREYYLTHRQDYTQPEAIQVAHILWRVQQQCPCEDQNEEKRKPAETVLAELRGGADFAELARKYSQDEATAKRGGSMDRWITRGLLVKPFEEVAFSLPEPGAISDVVKTNYGYHIIKLLDRHPETVQPFEQVKGSIVVKLAKDYQATLHKEYVKGFFPDPAQFNKAAIDALVKPSADPTVK